MDFYKTRKGRIEIIPAIKYNGINYLEILEYFKIAGDVYYRGMEINTLELITDYGKIYCPVGNWVLKTPSGNILTVSSELFDLVFEPVRDESDHSSTRSPTNDLLSL